MSATLVARGLAAGHGARVLFSDLDLVVAPETAQRIVCDASVRRAREREGVILDHGRRKRTVPPTLRRALRLRDRGCRYPGCTNRLFTDAHHVQHWTNGGETKLDLTLLCRYHHHNFLTKGWTCHLNSDGLPEWQPPRWLDPEQKPILNTRIQLAHLAK